MEDKLQLDALALLRTSALLPSPEDTEALIARLKARIRDLEAGVVARDEHIDALLSRVKHLTAVFT